MAYSYKMIKSNIGDLLDCSAKLNDSLIAEVNIPFGVPVMRGTDRERQVILYDGESIGVSPKFLGISVRNPYLYKNQYSPTDPVTVITRGRILVGLKIGLTVAAGNIAYLDVDSITNVLDPGKTIPIGIFLTGGISDGVDSPLNITFAIELQKGFEE